jgi:hypothetical protein
MRDSIFLAAFDLFIQFRGDFIGKTTKLHHVKILLYEFASMVGWISGRVKRYV